MLLPVGSLRHLWGLFRHCPFTERHKTQRWSSLWKFGHGRCWTGAWSTPMSQFAKPSNQSRFKALSRVADGRHDTCVVPKQASQEPWMSQTVWRWLHLWKPECLPDRTTHCIKPVNRLNMLSRRKSLPSPSHATIPVGVYIYILIYIYISTFHENCMVNKHTETIAPGV